VVRHRAVGPVCSAGSATEGTAVDDQRKSAYRNLLYLAMLDIRPVERLGTGGWWAIAIHGRREVRRVEWAGAIADWLHNLALFSAHDFRGFDEQRFWREFEAIRSGYPEFGPDRYRARFEQLAGAPPSRRRRREGHERSFGVGRRRGGSSDDLGGTGAHPACRSPRGPRGRLHHPQLNVCRRLAAAAGVRLVGSPPRGAGPGHSVAAGRRA
jgi:hypothetical protein